MSQHAEATAYAALSEVRQLQAEFDTFSEEVLARFTALEEAVKSLLDSEGR